MMSGAHDMDLAPIRQAMGGFEISPSIQPNEEIDLARVSFPGGHRGVLDIKRQLVVGNRGMGKSFWTHALTNPEVREQLARAYSFPKLANTKVVIGFNGSIKLSGIAPTIEEIQRARQAGNDAELIWRAVILRAARSLHQVGAPQSFADALSQLKAHSGDYAQELTKVDDEMATKGSSILVVFDALDRLAYEWGPIRDLTKGLLLTVLGLQSFRCIRAKVFMRVDQFADTELFRFPDSSKISNDRVDLTWHPHELFGLLIFELLRQQAAASVLEKLAQKLNVHLALPTGGRLNAGPQDQEILITAIAGEYMGKDRKRGRVYTWVPLHLGDAANNCSPRTFLTAWKTAAEHVPSPQKLAVDYLGLNEGVRKASGARLAELREDYPWIDDVLEPLRRQFVPIQKAELLQLWKDKSVTERILERSSHQKMLAPIGMFLEGDQDAVLQTLLQTMTQIAVMEERANGKINVPDIFRVEAEILRKGGVAVPRRS
jgi:hypothetical protein